MNFTAALRTAPLILAEGAVIERLRREPTVTLDPHVLNAALLFDAAGRARLRTIYRGYLDIGRDYALPMIILTPTWRANPERLAAAGLTERDANAHAVRFLAEIRAECGGSGAPVFVGGLIGCRGDAYRPAEALSTDHAAAFHDRQARELASAGVDFLLAATLPAFSEALGIARAMAACNLPYLLSFVVRPRGVLLDGTPLADAVRRIDEHVSPPPTAYMVNCTHPTVFADALTRGASVWSAMRNRVIGLQGNTSRRPPEELDGAADLDAEDPHAFAAEMWALHERFGTRILGGCCGTDERHVRGIAVRSRV